MELLLMLWYIVYIVQTLLSFGTAYRFTKKGGDNGVALFGWTFVFNMAALVPGLGIYLWSKNKEIDVA